MFAVAENDLTGLSVLIVEDDPLLSKRIASRLESLGTDVTRAASIESARQILDSLDFDLVLLDVHLPDGLGTDLLREQVIPVNSGVIVMTAQGGVEGAVEAMRLGAVDYLVKPFEPTELPLVIRKALRSRRASRLDQHRKDSKQSLFFGQALKPLEEQLEKIIAADHRIQNRLPPVLINGETGTGKTSFARWLHEHGPRSDQQLVEVNCSALPESLAESELFGHERGAFTDARRARMGLFEAADGGTLFLDELPSLSPALQAKVLTAIEDCQVRRVGSNTTRNIDVRLIAATNQDLKQAVAEGRFREDLYHRLDLYRLEIPPLRERGSDMTRLAGTFLRRLCQRHRLSLRRISDLGEQRMRAYSWPGNVRELEHELERAIVFEEATELEFPHLQPTKTEEPSGPDSLEAVLDSPGFSLEGTIDQLIEIALARTDGNVSAAARLLSVPRDYIRYRKGQKNKKPRGK